MVSPKDWFALHDEFFNFVPICYHFVINKIYINVQWMLISPMNRTIMMFSSKKQYDDEKIGPLKPGDDT